MGGRLAEDPRLTGSRDRRNGCGFGIVAPERSAPGKADDIRRCYRPMCEDPGPPA